MTNILVLGAGHSSLKFISLLRLLYPSSSSRLSITLIAPNKHFLFLPLLSNFIDQTIKLEQCSTYLPDFCAHYNISYFHQAVPYFNSESDLLNSLLKSTVFSILCLMEEILPRVDFVRIFV